MDDWGVAPAMRLFIAVLRLSLPKGEGRVRVSLCWDLISANSSPQSSPLTVGERREEARGLIGHLANTMLCSPECFYLF
jgi:hypothetical protein